MGTLSVLARERFLLWADMAKVAWRARQTLIARQAAEHVMSVELKDVVKDRDLLVLQGEVAFVQGETFALELKQSQGSGDIFLSDTFTTSGHEWAHDNWTDFQVEEEQWNINQSRAGWLQVQPSTGRDIGAVKDATHRFFQETGWAIFDLSTRVELSTQDNANLIGGLSIESYADRDWCDLKLGHATSSDGSGKPCLQWEHKGALVAEVEVPSTSLYLRILKNYTHHTAYYKASADAEWVQLGEAIEVEFQTPFEAGLFAGNAGEVGTGCCDFEFFDVVTREEMATRRMIAGLRVGVQLGEAWIIRNAAIYAWNYNLPLLQKNRAHLFAGHLEELFEAFFANDGLVAKKNLPMACNLTTALAQAKEQQFALAKGGARQRRRGAVWQRCFS